MRTKGAVTWFTVAETAAALGVTPQRVRQIVRDEKLRAKKNKNGDWEIDAASIREYLEKVRLGRPLSKEPARSKRFGTGTPEAEANRVYNRNYRRIYRARQAEEEAAAAAKAKVKAKN